MDIQSLRKIIFPAINSAVSQIEKNNIDYNITSLRAIMNEALNGALNISHHNDTEVKGLFTGRGRAWARTDVCETNEVWLKIKESLESEAECAQSGSKMNVACTDLVDMFENAGFAWMRFSRSKNGMVVFNLRILGSKFEDSIKVYISDHYIKNGRIRNLEGVPHNIGLESGDLKPNEIKKVQTDHNVSSSELMSFGIKTIEDLLS